MKDEAKYLKVTTDKYEPFILKGKTYKVSNSDNNVPEIPFQVKNEKGYDQWLRIEDFEIVEKPAVTG